jgi:hypothetical protein
LDGARAGASLVVAGPEQLEFSSMNERVIVDLILMQPDGRIVLCMVEEGPWSEQQVVEELRRVQNRLYDYMSVAVDGQLAKSHPDSVGRGVVIRLDCYDTPEEPVEEFFARFVAYNRNREDLAAAIAEKGLISGLEFEYSRDTLVNSAERQVTRDT